MSLQLIEKVDLRPFDNLDKLKAMIEKKLNTKVPCVDFSSLCSMWGRYGKCESDKSWMYKKCKKSCKFCTPSKEEELEELSKEEEKKRKEAETKALKIQEKTQEEEKVQNAHIKNTLSRIVQEIETLKNQNTNTQSILEHIKKLETTEKELMIEKDKRISAEKRINEMENTISIITKKHEDVKELLKLEL